MLKKIKIFVASSIEEFKTERIEIGDFFQELNELYLDYGIHFSLIKCEHIENSLVLEGKQSEYDEEIRSSDLSFFLFFKKVGDYTRHEFEIALESLRENNKPKIVTYFKTVDGSLSFTDEITAFIKMLNDDLHHYYNTFDHIDTLRLGMFLQIKRMNLDSPELSVNNGKICADGNTIADSKNIPMFSKNTKLLDYRHEYGDVAREYGEAKKKYIANPGDEKFYVKYSSLAAKKAGLEKKLRAAELDVLALASKMVDDISDGNISKRQLEGYRLFEAGDYEGALRVLDTGDIMAEAEVNSALADTAKTLLDSNVNELLQRIRVLKAQGLTAKTAKEVKSLFENIYTLISEHNLTCKPLYDYLDFAYEQNNHANALKAIAKLKYLHQNPDSAIDAQERAFLCTAAGKVYCEAKDYEKAQVELKETVRILEPLNADGKYDDRLSVAYFSLASMYFDTEKLDLAEENILKSDALRNKAVTDDEWDIQQLVAHHSLAANIYSGKSRNDKAVAEHKKALELALKLYEKNNKKYADLLASVYINLGLTCVRLDYYDDAERVYRAAEQLLIPLEQQNPDRHAPALATLYTHYANLASILKKNDMAQKMLKSSIKIREKLFAKYPSTYKVTLASSYSAAANLYLSQRNIKAAQKYSQKNMKLAQELYAENKEAYESYYSAAHALDSLVTTTANHMGIQTPKSEPDGGPVDMLESLQQKYNNDPETYGIELATMYQLKATELAAANKITEAASYLKTALNIVLKLKNKNRVNNLDYTVQLLYMLGIMNTRLQNFADGEKNLLDAEKGCEILVRDLPEIGLPLRAQVKLGLSILYIMKQDIKKAYEKDAEAVDCYFELRKMHPGQYGFEFAQCYEYLATIYAAGGALSDAQTSCERAVQLFRLAEAESKNDYSAEIARVIEAKQMIESML